MYTDIRDVEQHPSIIIGTDMVNTGTASNVGTTESGQHVMSSVVPLLV